jgi:hypothetical protein
MLVTWSKLRYSRRRQKDCSPKAFLASESTRLFNTCDRLMKAAIIFSCARLGQRNGSDAHINMAIPLCSSGRPTCPSSPLKKTLISTRVTHPTAFEHSNMPIKPNAHLPAKSGTFTTFKVERERSMGTARKRSSYSPVRRQEVKAVRKKGACLRCRVLQIKVLLNGRSTLRSLTFFIKCSCDDPCTTCLKLASTSETSGAFEKKVLRFSECIRTLLCEVSIFEHGKPPL